MEGGFGLERDIGGRGKNLSPEWPLPYQFNSQSIHYYEVVLYDNLSGRSSTVSIVNYTHETTSNLTPTSCGSEETAILKQNERKKGNAVADEQLQPLY